MKKIADDFKCLTQQAFKVPSIQIKACSLLSTAKGPEALFQLCKMGVAVASKLPAVKGKALYTNHCIRGQAGLRP